MNRFYKIIISDFRQRTRSYSFLVTVAISVYAAYSFVPAPDANYSTVMVGNYMGVQNAAWIGYITAMMTSIFLSWIGFYLINSNIRNDSVTRVGMIIATTSVSNFQYLICKAWSNFLVLLSIAGVSFLMSIALFFIRGGGYLFQWMSFLLPYLLITLPAIFFISCLAVTAEVFLYRYAVIMNIGFFFLFIMISAQQTTILPAMDLFGIRPVTDGLKYLIHQQFPGAKNEVSMGFIFGSGKTKYYFVFNGIQWHLSNLAQRLVWIVWGWLLIFISSRFFHRFDIRDKFRKIRQPDMMEALDPGHRGQGLKIVDLPVVVPSYAIGPFVITELKMIFRKGPRWLWLINLGGMISLVFAPVQMATQFILPIIWFLQAGRWSDLATREKTYRIHYFTYASYKPISRLLMAQIIAGCILAVALALPLIIRYLFSGNFLTAGAILAGGILIVLLAVVLGILSGGKKLFEILFFLLTYSNINLIPYADYFGALHQSSVYLLGITLLLAVLAGLAIWLRSMEIRRF